MNTPAAIPPRQARLKIQPVPITFLATAFVVLVCVSLLAIEGLRSWSARAIQLHQAEVESSQLVRALSQHADSTLKQVDAVLAGLTEQLELEGSNPVALERLHKLLPTYVSELPQLNDLSIDDKNGQSLIHARNTQLPNISNADRDYFVFHRSNPYRGPHVGPPARSRFNGAWIITVSRRFNHADGSFAGVVLANVDIIYFKAYYDSFDIGRGGAIILILDNGTILVRRPFFEDAIGKNMSIFPIFRDATAKNMAASVTMATGQDGVERLIAYHHLDRYPLFLTVLRSKDDVYSDWRTNTYLHLVGSTILALALGLLGWRLIHQINLRLLVEADLLVVQDSLKAINQSLEQLALHDSLTGLANRRHFDTALRDEFIRAMRNGSSLALIMMDVDYFKQYNDTYGHLAGDACLQRISQVVKTGQNRPGDLATRYGGEELAVLLPNTSLAGAMAVAEKIRLGIIDLKIVHPRNPAGVVTISAGVDAFIPVRDGNTPLELIQAADKALYAAKSSGRNRVCSHADAQSTPSTP